MDGAALPGWQRTRSVDAGDHYLTPHGERRLHRLAGAVAVRMADQPRKQAAVQELTVLGGPLAGYATDVERASGLLVFKAPDAERERHLRDASVLQQTLVSVRAAASIKAANPVFIDPQSGLQLIHTEEMIIRLKSDQNPAAFFGADWPKVRPLPHTTDQFILTLAGFTAEQLLIEVNKMARDVRVEWAEPNFIAQAIKNSSPNDPHFSNQWHLNNTGQGGGTAGADVLAPSAWNFSTGTTNIVIAIIDDGIQTAHPDLKDNIFTNPGESLNGMDDDNNGYPDDLHGWNFIDNNNNPDPSDTADEHGTAVAGVAAAEGNNVTGVAGIAYGCRILPVKVIKGTQWLTNAQMATALRFAAGLTTPQRWRGADVISISLGFPQSSTVDSSLTDAASLGRGGKGCPIFVATGNAAGKWMYGGSRLRLHVGADFGSGSYYFGFQYRKDATGNIGEDLVKIDNVVLLGSDGITQVNSSLGPNGRQDFEGAFPPSGWTLSSSNGVNWYAANMSASTGTGGSWSARSGTIGASQWTELRTPLVSLTGAERLAFADYFSSETDYDGLYVYVYNSSGELLGYYGDPYHNDPLHSGNPTTSAGIAYPASHTQTIAVGASTDCDKRSDYSQYGTGLDFLAPSNGGWNDVVSTDRTGTAGYNPSAGVTGDYDPSFGGTSSATPLAAGVGALVLSVNPGLTAGEVQTILRNTCDQIGGVSYVSGWNSHYGYGRVNAQRACRLASGVIYVRGSYNPPPPSDGSLAAPFRTVAEGYQAAQSGNIIRISSGEYRETNLRMDKPLLLEATDGTVNIGIP